MTAEKTGPRASPAGVAALSRQRLVQYFFFGVFLLLLYQLLGLLSPFYIAVLGSGVLALLVHPLHARLAARLPQYPSVTAGLSTAAVVVVVVLPSLLFGWAFLKDAGALYPAARDWTMELRELSVTGAIGARLSPETRAAWEGARRLLEFWGIDLQDIVLKNLDELSSGVTGLATQAIRNTVFVVFNLLMLAFTLFFFLRDGPFIIRRLTELVPMTPEHKESIFRRLRETLDGLVRGVLALGALQGLLTGLGFAALGVPFPVILGVLALVLSPIPIVGLTTVLAGTALVLWLAGAPDKAIYASLWGLAVLAAVERFLRPALRTEGQIPALLLFFSLLGGVRVYGFIGVLLGPILIALALGFVNIYRKEYRWLLQGAGPTEA